MSWNLGGFPRTERNGRSKLRDWVAWRASSWLLNTIASKEYSAFIYVLMKFGREELDRRLLDGENE